MIELKVRPHADRLYHVLAHLDTGRDAASIYDPTLPRPEWLQPLLDAYLSDPQRLQLQFLALRTDSLPEMLCRLNADPPGRALRDALLTALSRTEPAPSVLPSTDTQTALCDRLGPLRIRLWEPRPAPPLRLIHCAPLGKHARALSQNGTRRVITSLNEALERVLIQVIHEECHPLSDPTVGMETQHRDTRRSAKGYAIHRALEEAAVGLQALLIREHAPDLWDAHRSWCQEFSMPADLSGT